MSNENSMELSTMKYSSLVVSIHLSPYLDDLICAIYVGIPLHFCQESVRPPTASQLGWENARYSPIASAIAPVKQSIS
jgi:hypothetical protein